MPVFHTKTMEMILEPVAQQVAQLVVLHEEAEDGNAMPDLTTPVQTVRLAVEKLIEAAYATLSQSNDVILKHDMPPALTRVEDASLELVKAAHLLKIAPLSDEARTKLIDGSRGILHGTSNLLLAFDEYEVRKIVKVCKAVLEYLAISEVVEDMTDLVTYIEKLSPGLTDMAKLVDGRVNELTHATHREALSASLTQTKNYVPVLIKAMKAYITTKQTESEANRDFLVKKMSDEIMEVIRILQLTTCDEEQWDEDDITSMKKLQNAIETKMLTAHGWLCNQEAPVGGSGPASIRLILENARKIAEMCIDPSDQRQILKLAGDTESLFNSLCELRETGQGHTPAAQRLQAEIQSSLNQLKSMTQNAVTLTDRKGITRPAHTISGQVQQALRWVSRPQIPDNGLGEQATKLVVAEGRKAAQLCSGPQRAELTRLCDEIEISTNRLKNLVETGMGSSPEATTLANDLSRRLPYLQSKIENAICIKVVDDFADVNSPLLQLSRAALAPPNTPNREKDFEEKAAYFIQHGNTLADTAISVAVTMSGSHNNKANVELLLKSSHNAKELIPQIVHAAKIVLRNPDNPAAMDNFKSLQEQWKVKIENMTALVDHATDTLAFIKASEDAIRRDTDRAEEGIKMGNTSQIVGNLANIARLANRVSTVVDQEAENSSDPVYVSRLNIQCQELKGDVSPLVVSAKEVALNPRDGQAVSNMRMKNHKLIDDVVALKHTVATAVPDRFPPPPDLSSLNITPPRYVPDPSPHPPHETKQPPPVAKKPCTPAEINYKQMFNQMPHEQINRVVMAPSASERMNRVNAAQGDQYRPVDGQDNYMHNTEQPKVEVVDQMLQRQQEQALRTSAPVAHIPPPPVPPPPQDAFYRTYYGGEAAPPRPPPPSMPQETDDEDETFFPLPQANQPIMIAAHDLHLEAKQWSSKDNEIIAAAKQMAILMAKLSMIVRGEGGSKKELIGTAKQIVLASQEVTKAARKLADECTDRRVRLALLQVCERIPTIGTQLKILSTVKATMLGSQEPIRSPDGGEISCGTDEDQEATEMLVGNAQNLMQSVKETVRAAEAASIRIRVDSGYSIQWLRRKPWYT